jgi:hypothetical protein
VLFRDDVPLHLLRLDEAPHDLAAPVQAQFWVNSGLDDLFARAESPGVKALQRPADRPWGIAISWFRIPTGTSSGSRRRRGQRPANGKSRDGVIVREASLGATITAPPGAFNGVP